jgi:phage protein U
MAYVGILGSGKDAIVFKVSDEAVETFRSMQWNGSARISTHQRHLKNALTEFTGRDADTVSFEMQLHEELGVNVMDELTKIWKAERDGISLPLVIGDHAYGKYRWLVKSHKTNMQYFTPDGHMTGATVSVSLIEYLSQ